MESANTKKRKIILTVNGGKYILLYNPETRGGKARQAPGFPDNELFFFVGSLEAPMRKVPQSRIYKKNQKQIYIYLRPSKYQIQVLPGPVTTTAPAGNSFSS